MSRHSRRVAPTEKQLLVLVFALEKFRSSINPNKLTIFVPDKSLERVFKLVHKPERVETWISKIPFRFDTFDFQIDPTVLTKTTKHEESHLAEEVFYIDGASK